MFVAEAAKAPRVAELMAKFQPGVHYKVMDQGKAYLARKLEQMFNAEKMIVTERTKENKLVKREIKHTFEAYLKLNKQIQEHYCNIFGRPACAKVSTSMEEEPTDLLPFGFGAFGEHRR